MSSLRELQGDIAAAVLDGESAAWGVAAYRNNAFGSWTGALANAYPIVRRIVGEKFFEAMARRFAREHPSTSGDLNEFGARLAGFVAVFPDTQDLPYLSDVARMEWLAHLACYASDAAAFDSATLANLSPERYALLRPRRAPGSALLRSDWPLERIWAVHQDDYEGDFSVDLRPGLHRVLIHRPRWRVQVARVTLGEFRFLAGAERGEPLGELTDAALSLDPSFDPAVSLPRWIQAGAIAL